MDFFDLFKNKKPIIACIHLMPLPGSPGYEGNMSKIIKQALTETTVLKNNKVDGLIIENFRDYPFYPDQLPPESIAALAAVAQEVIKNFPGPVGVNALRNDAHSALAIAVATDAQFIRINVHTGAAITDQGLIQGKAHNTLRLRNNLKAKNILIFADVAVKHASPLGKRNIELETHDLTERGLADAIIVSGNLTGALTDVDELKLVKQSTHLPILIGSGTTPNNLNSLYTDADGFIVGSYFKKDGKASNFIEEKRVQEFMKFYKTKKL